MEESTKKKILGFVQKQITNIDLSNENLSTFPTQLFAIPGITHLKLSNNKITSLPPGIRNLTNLRHLNLSGNMLTELPEEFGSLSSMNHLNLSENKFLFFPEVILKLSNLEILYLIKNSLINIPFNIRQMSSMRILFLRGNSISNIPSEIIQKDGYVDSWSAISNYFEEMENGQDELYEAKLIIVGRGAVGKSSLANKIVDSDYQLQTDIDTTRGIDILSWQFPFEENGKNEQFRVNIWDFGGQQIYYKTHQFFLTKRSYYLLMWDARSEENYKTFSYWLNAIRLLSNSSPVVIVQNKVDERVEEIEQKLYLENFPSITGFHKISCSTNKGIADLKDHLQEGILKLPHVGDLLPSVWLRIRKTLQDLTDNFITYQKYLEICESFSLNATKANHLSDYLHDLGSILHFSEDILLKNMVVLKPDWATQAVYSIIDDQKAVESFGELLLEDIEAIWVKNNYPDRHAELLQLMKKFEMCFEVEDQKHFIIPQLLRTDQPDDFHWEGERDMLLEYSYKFMPIGIFTRLMVKLHSYIEQDNFWRNGVVLSLKNTRAFIRNLPLSDKIVIQLKGADKAGFLSRIRMTLADIHASLNHPEYDELCGCVCSKCTCDNRKMIKIQDLHNGLNHGVKEIQCQNSWEYVKIEKILLGIDDFDESKVNQRNSENSVDQFFNKEERLREVAGVLHDHLVDNSRSKREINYLKSQLDIVMEELSERNDRQNALNAINAFLVKNSPDITNSVTGGLMIEIGKLLMGV